MALPKTSLEVGILADGKQYDRGMRQVEYRTAQAQRRMSKDFKKVNSATQRLAKGVAAIAGAFLGLRFIQQKRELIQYGDELGKLSRRLGITAEEFQALKYQADSLNIPFSRLQSGIQRFQGEVAGIKFGTSELGLSLKKMNAELFESIQRTENTSEAMNLLFDALKGVSRADSLAVLSESFGTRSGAALQQIKDEGGNLSEITADVQQRGYLATNRSILILEEMNQTLTDIWTYWRGVSLNSLADVITYFREIYNNLRIAFQPLTLFIRKEFGASADVSFVGRQTSDIEAAVESSYGNLVTTGRSVRALQQDNIRLLGEIAKFEKPDENVDIRTLGLATGGVPPKPKSFSSADQDAVDELEKSLKFNREQLASLEIERQRIFDFISEGKGELAFRKLLGRDQGGLSDLEAPSTAVASRVFPAVEKLLQQYNAGIKLDAESLQKLRESLKQGIDDSALGSTGLSKFFEERFAGIEFERPDRQAVTVIGRREREQLQQYGFASAATGGGLYNADLQREAFEKQFQVATEAIEIMRQKTQELKTEMEGVGKAISSDIVNGLRQGADAADILRSVVSRLLDRIIEAAIIDPIGNLFGGFLRSIPLPGFGGVGGAIGAPIGAFIPGGASGGRIMDAGLLRVGEAGPETIALPAGATVFPRGDLSQGRDGGVTINVYGTRDETDTYNAIKAASSEIKQDVLGTLLRDKNRPGRGRAY